MRSDRQPALPMPDAVLAQHYRTAAETERRNPYFPPDVAEQRARYYEAQAERLAPTDWRE